VMARARSATSASHARHCSRCASRSRRATASRWPSASSASVSSRGQSMARDVAVVPCNVCGRAYRYRDGGVLHEPDMSSTYALGRARWPALALSETAFAARFAALDSGHVDDERAGDLFLAFAVGERVPGATEAFHHELERELAVVHRRFRD